MSDLLNKASLVMVPSGYKEDTVYSVVPTDGSGDLAFTRASNGTRVNSAGLVEVCPWNLIRYSEEFDNTAWVKANSTVTANQTTAPNGTTTADKIEISNATNATVQQGVSSDLLISGLPCTFTVYLKSVSGTGKVGIRSGQTGLSSLFNFTNEWQRFTWTFNSAASLEIPQFCNNTLVGGADSAPSFYAWGAQLNIGSTAKPYFPTTDRLNVPRLTYQNGGGGCPSLLLEKQSTNIVTYSEEFDNAAWGKYQCSISANQTTSPDGTQNADKLTLAVGSGTYTGLVYRLTTPGANSIFMKNDSIGNGKFYIQVDGIGNARWNSDGTLASVSGGTATNGENMGNGWFRFTYVCSGGAYINYGIENGTTGDSIFIWGAQVEASSYATSYIPTTSSSATRVADACYKTGISSLIGQTEGVAFVDFDFNGNYSSGGIIPISLDGGGGNELYIWVQTSGLLLCEVANSGSNQVSITGAIGAIGRKKIAFAYKQNDFIVYMNGSQFGNDTSGSVPTMSRLYVGKYFANDIYNMNAVINQAILFPTRLTNAELASLTTL